MFPKCWKYLWTKSLADTARLFPVSILECQQSATCSSTKKNPKNLPYTRLAELIRAKLFLFQYKAQFRPDFKAIWGRVEIVLFQTALADIMLSLGRSTCCTKTISHVYWPCPAYGLWSPCQTDLFGFRSYVGHSGLSFLFR